ncbi:MAG TPA: hypothetical protein VK400_06590 [Pyrinomonadaceae bacterium]|nr:hypothetical protein [Pyrinomonadaceae bacterium]
MIKDFGARVEKAWEGLRPMTKKMLVGAIEANTANSNAAAKQKFSYDAHADWELSRLLTALDEQSNDAEIRKDAAKSREIKQLAETCTSVLQAQTESAEVFVQLAERALKQNDYRKIDVLADILSHRFSVGEMCEIVRQTTNPAIRALGFEALALVPVSALMQMVDDPVYFEIVRCVLEQQAFEYESEEARRVLEQLDFEEVSGE